MIPELDEVKPCKSRIIKELILEKKVFSQGKRIIELEKALNEKGAEKQPLTDQP